MILLHFFLIVILCWGVYILCKSRIVTQTVKEWIGVFLQWFRQYIWTHAITSELLANYPLICLECVAKRETKYQLGLWFLAFHKAQLMKLVLHASTWFLKSKCFLVLAIKLDLQEPFKQVPHFALELWAFDSLILSAISCMLVWNCSN